MNTTPMLRGKPAHEAGRAMPTSCGRLAMKLTERAFWMSRATIGGIVPRGFEMVDIPTLAKEIRHAFASN